MRFGNRIAIGLFWRYSRMTRSDVSCGAAVLSKDRCFPRYSGSCSPLRRFSSGVRSLHFWGAVPSPFGHMWKERWCSRSVLACGCFSAPWFGSAITSELRPGTVRCVLCSKGWPGCPRSGSLSRRPNVSLAGAFVTLFLLEPDEGVEGMWCGGGGGAELVELEDIQSAAVAAQRQSKMAFHTLI